MARVPYGGSEGGCAMKAGKPNGAGDSREERTSPDTITERTRASDSSIVDASPSRDGVVQPLATAINLSEFTISQDFGGSDDRDEPLAKIEVRKPTKFEFVRVHPDPAYSLQALAIYLPDSGYRGDYFLVHRRLQDELRDELVRILFILAVSRGGPPFIWPLRMPASSGRFDDWGESALRAADRAKHEWLRVRSDPEEGRYRVVSAEKDWGDPRWPRESLDELMALAFSGKQIRDLQHPVVRRLRGAI